MNAKSRFVWHDLMAADVEGAKRFYGELFGWKFRHGDKDPYEHISAGDVDIGGIVTLAPGDNVPPHWIGYISTDDVAATVATVTQSGGRVFVPPTSIPTVGTFAVVADPQGAIFSPFHYTGKGAGEPEPSGKPSLYTFCWDELASTDPDAAAKFYNQVFGWGAEHMDMPGFGRYTLLKRTGIKDEMGADKSAGGLMKLPPGAPAPFWLTYVAVPNADATLDKAARLGGNVTVPATDIPGVGRFGCFLDAQNAALAILQPLT